VRVAYATNNIETVELLSKMAGTTMIVERSYSYSGSKYGTQSQLSTFTQKTQRRCSPQMK